LPVFLNSITAIFAESRNIRTADLERASFDLRRKKAAMHSLRISESRVTIAADINGKE